MHIYMTAVTIQINKIVSSEVGGSYALLGSLYGKKLNFLVNPIKEMLRTKMGFRFEALKSLFILSIQSVRIISVHSFPNPLLPL